MTRGICYVAYGKAARREMSYSVETLKRYNNLPVFTVDGDIDGPDGMDDAQRSRWAKVNLDRLSPFDLTCYLDADTRPAADLSPGFQMLADGWDIVLAHSENQDGHDLLWHVGPEERGATLAELGNPFPLQLQGGVFWFRKCMAVSKLFEAWRREWRRWRGPDQAALLRALRGSPVRVWLLGKPWNGGNLIRHRHGMAAR